MEKDGENLMKLGEQIMGSIGDVLLTEEDSQNLGSGVENFDLECCQDKESLPWDEKTRGTAPHIKIIIQREKARTKKIGEPKSVTTIYRSIHLL